MRINLMGMAVMSDDPANSAAWFGEHFGFQVGVDIGWYVNTQHPDHSNVSLDFVHREHESTGAALHGKHVAGTILAFLVDDVDAEDQRLRAAGIEFVLPLTTEPWGQRRFQIRGPDGLIVEVLQVVDPDPQWIAANLR